MGQTWRGSGLEKEGLAVPPFSWLDWLKYSEVLAASPASPNSRFTQSSRSGVRGISSIVSIDWSRGVVRALERAWNFAANLAPFFEGFQYFASRSCSR